MMYRFIVLGFFIGCASSVMTKPKPIAVEHRRWRFCCYVESKDPGSICYRDKTRLKWYGGKIRGLEIKNLCAPKVHSQFRAAGFVLVPESTLR